MMRSGPGLFSEAKRDCPFTLTVNLYANSFDYNNNILRVTIVYPPQKQSDETLKLMDSQLVEFSFLSRGHSSQGVQADKPAPVDLTACHPSI